jgi:predicted  nucleic acid-binding Zn-ribbon protein
MVNQWGRDAGPSGGNPGRSAGALIAAVIALVVGASGGYGTARYVQGDTGAAVAARDQTISDLQSELDAARSKTEKAGSREKSLEAELADLDAELKSLQSENDRLRAGKSDDAATAKEIKDLRAKLKTAEKTARDFAAAQDVIDQVQADLAKAQKAVAARDAAIKDLRAALADGGDLQAEIVRLTREKDVLVTELRDAQADRGDASQMEGEFRDLQLQAADLRDKLKQESAARARAEDRADAAEADVAKLTRRVSTLEDKLAGAETVRPRPGDTETKPRPVDPGQDEVGSPRDVDDVRNALADMPGYDSLASDKQKKLVKLLRDGQCVSDALKSVYGRAPAAALRSLMRDLRGAC